ncbi:hypothetical protein PVL29_022770 [Vitis rotundifolia]|uniref:Uncharacterized protein n=1 Tax=Vitis rotundifolia TaxID=103349 RepID=A0AA38YWH2_VITRO|nr:hypothetical protein PVL29_022770 [Vitis rotundifolia]
MKKIHIIYIKKRLFYKFIYKGCFNSILFARKLIFIIFIEKKGNKDLCGNVKRLQPSKYGYGVDQQLVKKSHKVVFIIIFLLLGALVLLFAFSGIFLIAERKERTPDIEEGDV